MIDRQCLGWEYAIHAPTLFASESIVGSLLPQAERGDIVDFPLMWL